MRPARLAALLGCATSSCLDATLPPLGEARFFVDTDLPVPSVVNHLRVDFYSADGKTWFESRDVPRIDPADWPISFGVRDPDPDKPRAVLVRLRAFHAAAVRDYRGERYQPRPTNDDPAHVTVAPVVEGDGPRLVVDGVDITPPYEPEPLATVDRLVRVELAPGHVGAVRVVLRGACAGTMADLANAQTCVSAEGTLEVADVALSSDLSAPASVVGAFGKPAPCAKKPRDATTAADGSSLYDDQLCVRGGVFLLGNEGSLESGSGAEYPIRVAVEPPFLLDKFEVSVARYKAAVAAGFVADVLANDGPFTGTRDDGSCTYTKLSSTRDSWPLNCITPTDAAAFCALSGGALPSESQYEFAAQVSNRADKARYPWGDAEPTCTRAIYGRVPNDVRANAVCASVGIGPGFVDQVARDDGDVALGSRAVNLAGGVGEYVADSFHGFDSDCWASASLVSPRCDDPRSPNVGVRGGGWTRSVAELEPSARYAFPRTGVRSYENGFRCVYPAR